MLLMIMEHIFIVLVLSIFQKKSKNSFVLKILKQIFSEYKHMIQLYVDTFAMDLLTLC